MPKIPDLNKLTEKFDFQGMINSVKSIINPGAVIPENLEGDPIAAKLALLTQGLQELSHVHAQQEQQIAKLNGIVNSLYQDLSAAKTAKTTTSTTGTTTTKTTTTTPKKGPTDPSTGGHL